MEGIRNYTSDARPSSGRILLKDAKTIRIEGDYDLTGRQLTQKDLDEVLSADEFIRETVEYISCREDPLGLPPAGGRPRWR